MLRLSASRRPPSPPRRGPAYLLAAVLFLPLLADCSRRQDDAEPPQEVSQMLPEAGTPPTAEEVTTFDIDLATVTHTMAGGLGASWHAISKDFEFTGLIRRLDEQAPRGSAWGGNPPPDNEAVWTQLDHHASWLGMDFVRVEISQRMYEPRRRGFDWGNEEMRALYRILDWCQENGAEVFLTQMWGFVPWNAYEGVPPLQSAPRSAEEFAHGLGVLLEELVEKRGYTNIRWLSIANEPNSRWFLGPGGARMSLEPVLQAVRGELDARGIDVGLSAPGFSDLADGRDEVFHLEMDVELAAYDAHSWGRPIYGGMANWASRARQRGIPFFLSEIGDMRFGWQGNSPGPASWGASLSTVTKVILGLNLGVDGFNRWSFTNRGDLDGQFQLVRTWDPASRSYLDSVEPEPVPYYVYGLLTRLSAKHSQVLGTRAPEDEYEVIAACLRSPAGNLTVLLLNNDEVGRKVRLRFSAVGGDTVLHRYVLTESAVLEDDYELASLGSISLSPENNEIQIDLPPASVAALTTFDLDPMQRGIIDDRR